MPPKVNPLRLNPLQRKTLAILQQIARSPSTATEAADGGTTIASFPPPHGDHFHVGDAIVMGRDASGLRNEGVWKALERKGLARELRYPLAITLTAKGRAYETGVADQILHRSDH